MSSSCGTAAPSVVQFKEKLRAEAAIPPDAVAAGPVTKETQIIAIYGKGGIGKSFTPVSYTHLTLPTILLV